MTQIDLSQATTLQNLVAAFSGEAMANRKYLFFCRSCPQAGVRGNCQSLQRNGFSQRMLDLLEAIASI